MTTELKSLDFKFIVRELRNLLLGGKFRKIYQYGQGQKQFLFDIYASTKGDFWLYSDSEALFIAQHKKESPLEPPNFCMFLRKHLNGKTIKDIRQHGFDRIIEIVTDSNILILEFVPPGNVILTDSFYNVIMPLQVQRWKDRSVIPKRPYIFPPEQLNPYSISLETFRNAVGKQQQKIVTVIAKMGFGSIYANEICLLASIEKEKNADQLSIEEITELFTKIREFGGRKAEPVTYEDGKLSLFPLRSKKEKILGRWSGLSAPLDELHSKAIEKESAEEQAKESEAEKDRIRRIVEKQEKIIDKLKEKTVDKRENADTIYSYYGLVDDVLTGIRRAMESGLNWSEIKNRIENEPTPEAEAIVEIREHEGIVVVNLGGKEIELDFRKSVEENAGDFYDGSKTARKKAEGAEVAAGEKLEELKMIEEAPPEEAKPVVVKKKRQPRKRWYESFRWFISSKKFLIVAGKDSTSNERLIKKKTDPDDMVFHTDIQGSAFVVIKAKTPRGTRFANLKPGEGFPLEVKKEASEIAAACSKAWSKGLGNVDVYAVKPEQVSKSPPSGMSLPKGSFMIYGSKEWFRDVELKMSIGALLDRKQQRVEVIAGPVMAIRMFSKYFITLRPGDMKSHDLGNEILNKLLYKATPEDRPLIEKINTNDIEKLIPSGTGMLVN